MAFSSEIKPEFPLSGPAYGYGGGQIRPPPPMVCPAADYRYLETLSGRESRSAETVTTSFRLSPAMAFS